MSRSQTATEYLIILAVVIVIGLITVGVLGGIPSIGGGTGRNADSAELRTNKIGVMGHTLNSSAMKLLLRNNMPETISLNNLSIEGTVCSATNLPVILSSGRQTTVVCTNVISSEVSGTQYEYDLDINYTDVTAKADYEEDDLTLVGVVSGSAASGSVTYLLIEDDTEDEAGYSGFCNNPENGYNEIWSDFVGATANFCDIFINYTIPGNIVSVNIESKTADRGDTYLLCYNYSSGSYGQFYAQDTGGTLTINRSVPSECVTGALLRIQVRLGLDVIAGDSKLYEEKLWWNVSS